MQIPKIFLVLCLFATFAPIANAEEPEPWVNPEVLRAAMQINMNADQRPQFRDAVSEFLQGYGADVSKLLRANNQTGLPRKITKKRNKRLKTMDSDMADFLNEEQIPAYETYRDLLVEKMQEKAASRRR